MTSIRVRFAPSPTGFFHLGGARTALFNWLYAKNNGGVFVVRVEDTDKKRNSKEFLKALLEGMMWLDLVWDEGPIFGGKNGPYFQSERTALYKKYINKLKRSGCVYKQNEALYFSVSNKIQSVNDLVYGKIRRLETKDFIIVRSGGQPVFHLTNVVDDAEMGITHVIRGEDHLSNTGKYIEISNALNLKIPIFVHIPLILNSNDKGKMSKRNQSSLVIDHQKLNFIPESIKNYLSLLGWSNGNNQEVFSIEKIVKFFLLKDINNNNAKFDNKKLSYINSRYIKLLNFAKFLKSTQKILAQGNFLVGFTEEYITSVVLVVREKTNYLSGIVDLVKYFFSDWYKVDTCGMIKIKKSEDIYKKLKLLVSIITQIEDFSVKYLFNIFNCRSGRQAIDLKRITLPVRIIISGRIVGPSFFHMLNLIGKKQIIYRINRFISKNIDSQVS